MNLLVLNILLSGLWAALTGQFTLQSLVAGFILGYFTLFLMRGLFGPTIYFRKGVQALRFIVFFLWELIIANIRVARDVLRPGPLRMRPRVIAVPLEKCSDVAVTVLANVLSLTPGTLSLDVAKDECYLYVHSINAPDGELEKKNIKQGFERLVIDLFETQQPLTLDELEERGR